MKREIEFRGKRVDNGEWVYGDLVHDAISAYSTMIKVGIRQGGCYPDEVNPDTIGQYTGLTDRNGVKMWEGDLVRHFDDTMVIVYRHGAFFHKHLTQEAYGVIFNEPYQESNVANYYEVTGNIHESCGCEG